VQGTSKQKLVSNV